MPFEIYTRSGLTYTGTIHYAFNDVRVKGQTRWRLAVSTWMWQLRLPRTIWCCR